MVRNEPTDAGAVGDAGERVEVAGTALVPADRESIEAPFSGRGCCYCQYQVLKREGTSDNKSWQATTEGFVGGPIRITDGTGEVIVDPGDQPVNGNGRVVETVDSGRPPATLRNRLWDHGELTPEDVRELVEDSTSTRKYQERRVGIGDDVHVTGVVDDPTVPRISIDDEGRLTLGGQREAATEAAKTGIATLFVASFAGVIAGVFLWAFLSLFRYFQLLSELLTAGGLL